MTARTKAMRDFQRGETRTVFVQWHGATLAAERIDTEDGPIYMTRHGTTLFGAKEIG